MTTVFVAVATTALAFALCWFNSRVELPDDHRYRSILLRSLLSIALLVAAWIGLGTVFTIADGAPMILILQAFAANAPLLQKKIASSSQPS